jgi:dTDP-4-amino-4,6-dideoxygalactose transaminase
MTEFCAAIGQNSLKKLNLENNYRVKNIIFLLKKFPEEKYFKIILPQKNCTTTFYKLPLIYEYKNFKKNLNFFIKYMNKLEIPFSHAYTPLSHHSNFNINKKKNKSFPNIDLNYKKQRNFKNTFDICYNKLTELSIHRPVGKYHLNYLIKNLKIYINKYGLK